MAWFALIAWAGQSPGTPEPAPPQSIVTLVLPRNGRVTVVPFAAAFDSVVGAAVFTVSSIRSGDQPTVALAPNSEVLLPGSVAVAVTRLTPLVSVTPAGNVIVRPVKLPDPASVVSEPSQVAPSPEPEASLSLRYTSTRLAANAACPAAEPTWPARVSTLPSRDTAVSRGESISRFAAVPAAPLAPSLAATAPSAPRSMPRPPLPRMALPRIAIPLDAAATDTPAPVFDAMVFGSPAAVPPIVLAVAPSTCTPAPVFGRAVVPSEARPTVLPRTTWPAPDDSRMPGPTLPDTTLSSAVTFADCVAPAVVAWAAMPASWLGSAVCPSAPRPIQLPRTVTAAVPLSNTLTP